MMGHKHIAWRRDWGESCAFLVVLGLYLGVPNRYTLGGPEVSYVLGILLAVACGLSIVFTITGTARGARGAMLSVAAILTLILFASLSRLVYLVVFHASQVDGARLLGSALVIWIANVVLFAVFYRWIGADDFIFPQKEGVPPRRLVFLDFLFLSFTTATAFSPTDTAPITTKARMLMMLESVISLTTIAIAAARAVNILQ
jgi:hypothetical protein